MSAHLILVFRVKPGCRQYPFHDAAAFTAWAGRSPYKSERLRIQFYGADSRLACDSTFVPEETGHGAAALSVSRHFRGEKPVLFGDNKPTVPTEKLLICLKWCMAQMQGDSGTGESYWEQFPEYRDARAAIEAAEAF